MLLSCGPQALQTRDEAQFTKVLSSKWASTHDGAAFPQAALVAQVLLDTPPESLPLPYRTLGLSSLLASRATVKRLYRQASLKNHPDRNPSKGAHLAMQELNQAKHCLDDQGERDKVYHDFLSTRV